MLISGMENILAISRNSLQSRRTGHPLCLGIAEKQRKTDTGNQYETAWHSLSTKLPQVSDHVPCPMLSLRLSLMFLLLHKKCIYTKDAF